MTAPTAFESWRPVRGFEGAYEVSDQGRVRSVDRVSINRGREHHVKGRILRQGGGSGANYSDRYFVVCLSWGSAKRFARVHRLVAEAFVPGESADLLVRHWDGNPQNNKAENLRWGTNSDNMLDAVRHGTHSNTAKTHCPRDHRLEAPNLIAGEQRRCLACYKAHRHAKRMGTAATADLYERHYRAILAGTTIRGELTAVCGGCARPLRRQKTTEAEYPGTVPRISKHLCSPCHVKAKQVQS